MEISLSYHNLESYDIAFNLSNHYMTELFSRILHQNDFASGKINKVAIALIRNRNENLVLYNEGVLLIKTNFDLLNSSYENALHSGLEKLNLIYNALKLIPNEYRFDKNIIQQTYAECLKLNLKNEYYLGESHLSNNKLLYAKLWVEHTEFSFDLFIDIFRAESNNKIKRIKVLSTPPFWQEYRDYLVPIKSNKVGFYIAPKGGKPKLEFSY